MAIFKVNRFALLGMLSIHAIEILHLGTRWQTVDVIGGSR
jgi:hypothetical protein